MSNEFETERLDILIYNKGLTTSRERAKQFVLNGSVLVNDKVVTKPGQKVDIASKVIIIAQEEQYVSRGAFKLKKAIEKFGVDLDGKIAVDIGASTGGFTDFMLKNGAKMVYAVDVGHNQLVDNLRNDDRVIQIDKTNFRYVDTNIFKYNIDIVSIDVSFISLKYILPNVSKICNKNSDIIALVKPQFEAGRENIGKNGIVKSKKIHYEVLTNVENYCNENGLFINNITYSPITGGDGNIEYLVHIKNNDNNLNNQILDYKNIVKEAFNNLKINKNY